MSFYINPPALVNITELILSSIIFIYLWRLREKSASTKLMCAFFGGLSLFFVAFVFFNVSLPSMSLWRYPPLYISILGTMIFLLQFTYSYPDSLESQRLEAKIVLLISLVALVLGVVISIIFITQTTSGTSKPLPFFFPLSALVSVELIWCVSVLLRRSILLSEKRSGRKDKDATGARAFALLLCLPLLMAFMTSLRDSGVLPSPLVNSILPIGIQIFLFAFVVVYLNHSRESGSFMVKTMGTSLVVVLTFIGAVGYLVFPLWDNTFHSDGLIEETRTIRFSPQPQGKGYNIATIPSLFDGDYTRGVKLKLTNENDVPCDLNFPFPYAGQPRKKVYIDKNGRVTFAGSIKASAFWNNYQAGIAPLWGSFTIPGGKTSGIYKNTAPGRITITWANLLESVTHRYRTAQLTLKSDGTIEFSYLNVKGTRLYGLGLFSGAGNNHKKEIKFSRDLPYSSSSAAVIENFYTYYCQYIHDRMFPLALAIVFATLLILVIFPFFFKANLLLPLQSLQEGMKQVKQGKLSTTIPVRFNDEVGSLTESFNHMVQSLKEAKDGWLTAVKSKDKLLLLNTAILDTAAEGIITLDAAGNILSFNKAAENMFDYSREEVYGQPDHILLIKKNQSPMGFLDHYHTSGHKTRFGVDHQLHGQRRDGSFFPLEFAISVTDSEEGQIYTVMLHDLTEHQRMTAEKIKLEEQLHQSQKLETIGTLAGGIAHDFNNILTPIIGYAEMSLDSIPPNNEVSGYVQNILKSCYRARDLVKQILTFSRKNELAFKLVELYPIVKGVLGLLRASTPSTIAFNLNLSPDCGSIFGDQTQIEQVLLNLCTNATQAMLPAGGTLTVELQTIVVTEALATLCPALKQDNYILLQVSDTGTGIDTGTMKHIFEPFFTTKPVGQGTGLGLAMVQGIVEKHWGAVRVESEPGKGSSFSVYFPAILMTVIEKEMEEEKISTGNESILLVDDEEIIVEMYKELLQRAGYKVTAETCSRKTLELFRAQPDSFDLLITDNTMPELTGIQLAKEILAIRPNMPIILFTGNYDILSAETCKQQGITKLLGKPVFFRTLTQAIRQALTKQ